MRDVFLGYNSKEEKRLNRRKELENIRYGLKTFRENRKENPDIKAIRILIDDNFMETTIIVRELKNDLKKTDVYMQGYFNVINYAGNIVNVKNGIFIYSKEFEIRHPGVKKTISENVFTVQVYRDNFSSFKGMNDCSDDINQWLVKDFKTVTMVEHDLEEIYKIYQEYFDYIEMLKEGAIH